MSMWKTRLNNGYYIPFGSTVPVPLNEWNNNPSRMLLFNAEWQKYILGALKTLARPEIYQSDTPSELKFAMSQGMDMLGGVIDLPVAGVNWDVIFAIGGDYSISIDRMLNDFSATRYHFGAAVNVEDPPSGVLNLSLTGYETVTFNSAGGKVKVNLWHEPDVPKTYLITGVNCDGSFINDAGFTPGGLFTRTYNTCKSLSVSIDSINLLLAECYVTNNYTCVAT